VFGSCLTRSPGLLNPRVDSTNAVANRYTSKHWPKGCKHIDGHVTTRGVSGYTDNKPDSADGKPVNHLGALATCQGAPTICLGAPATSLGALPTCWGVLANTLREPATTLGALAKTLGVLPKTMGVLATTLGLPAMTLGVPANNTGSASNNPGSAEVKPLGGQSWEYLNSLYSSVGNMSSSFRTLLVRMEIIAITHLPMILKTCVFSLCSHLCIYISI